MRSSPSETLSVRVNFALSLHRVGTIMMTQVIHFAILRPVPFSTHSRAKTVRPGDCNHVSLNIDFELIEVLAAA